MADGSSADELRTSLLYDDAKELEGAEEGHFTGRREALEAAAPPPAPAWLSDRQGPLADSPSFPSLATASAFLPDQRRLAGTKPSRSSKRLGAAAASARARRQPWIVLDERGHRSFMHADKRAIINTTGLSIPIRDMRLLDVNLGAADSTILVRDAAIIVAMEHVRFIVTANRAIIPREGTEHNPLTARFVDVLEDAIAEWTRQCREYEAQQEAAEAASASGAGASGGFLGRPTPMGGGGGGGASGPASDVDDASSMHHEIQEPLPFELVVLEAALKEVVASLALQIKELEGVALPALDALTRSVTSAHLERVRKVKTRHQRLCLRTEALRDELHRFLQDDDDMAEMCLSRRRELEDAARAALGDMGMGGMGGASGAATPAFAPSSFTRRGGLALARFHSGGGGSPPQGRGGPGGAASALPSRDVMLAMGGGGGQSQAQAQAALAAAEEDADAEAQQDVENLLESYYMEVDGLYDKLVSIGEYVKDTEEFINIELDSARNRLIRFEVILTVATFSLLPFNLLAGILGENLIIPEQITGSVTQFYGVNLATTAACTLIFYVITLYMRHAKLL